MTRFAVDAVSVAAPRLTLGRRAVLYLELSKARLSALVLMTTLVGYGLAASGPVHWLRLGATLLGTLLAAFGANALNQWWEAARDARMRRTQGRPLPAGRLTAAEALAWGVGAAVAGPVMLAVAVNSLTAALAAGNVLLYVLAYTPLKPRSAANTLVGAVVGAVPPMMGWAAATGGLDSRAWALGAILFVWQIPHFLALAWLYRDDYRRGGFRMLPSLDPTGRLTALLALTSSAALAPLSLALARGGPAGWLYLAGGLALGAWLTGAALRFVLRRDEARARALFITSIIHLPLLLGLMVLDRALALL